MSSSSYSWYLLNTSTLIHMFFKYNLLNTQKDSCYLYFWDEAPGRKKEKRNLFKAHTGVTAEAKLLIKCLWFQSPKVYLKAALLPLSCCPLLSPSNLKKPIYRNKLIRYDHSVISSPADNSFVLQIVNNILKSNNIIITGGLQIHFLSDQAIEADFWLDALLHAHHALLNLWLLSQDKKQ